MFEASIGAHEDYQNNLNKIEWHSPRLIQFSQATVSAHFTDGSLVSDLSENLQNGSIHITEVSPIRIVLFKGKKVTMDNRRLRAFQDAMLDQVPVIICDLTDTSIYREFHSKRTNKSVEGGGATRAPFALLDFFNTEPQRFDEGPYIFMKRILTFNVEQLAFPIPSLPKKPLHSKFQSATEYYKSFLELIIEEAKASLQAGIEAKPSEDNKPFNFTLFNYKPAKKAENPSVLTFTKTLEEKRTVKAYDAFLLECPTQADTRYIAVSSYAPTGDTLQITLKVIIDEITYLFEASDIFEKGVEWKATPLGSLVTHMRMYDVCTACPQVPWLDQLFTGKLNPIYQQQQPTTPIPPHLNEAQKQVIQKFLAMEQGFQLVQGPPGTGKTTLLISLLKCLAPQGRILVCAPSNKALQVLAERFVSEYPEIPAILVGVEDKLADDNETLRDIFIHTWGSTKLDIIRHIKEKLWDLLPSHFLFGTTLEMDKKLDCSVKDIKALEKKLKALAPAFKKYELDLINDTLLKTFKKAVEEYENLMNTEGLRFSRENNNISKEFIKEPKQLKHIDILFFNNVRTLCSTLTLALTKFQTALQTKIMDDSSNGLEGSLLNQSRVIFATLSVSGRRMLKDMNEPIHALIIDEAGQAVEAETLIPFACRPEKCLLIGDTKQLPATVISTEAVRLNFDRSLIWRLLEECQQDFTLLTVQYRMDAEIRFWPSQQYYQGRLQDSEAITQKRRSFWKKPNIPRYIEPYAFINVEGNELNEGYSYKNNTEIEALITLLYFLKNQMGVTLAEDVGIITFYKGQADAITQKLKHHFPELKANTVDSVQGDEKNIIIISCVRANSKGKLGFVNDFRRLNVALTRGLYSVIVLGDAKTLKKGEGDLSLLVKDAEARQRFFDYQTIKPELKPKLTLYAFNQEKKTTAPQGKPTYSNHKTILCRYEIAKAGSCRAGAACTFAHNAQEKEMKYNKPLLKKQ